MNSINIICDENRKIKLDEFLYQNLNKDYLGVVIERKEIISLGFYKRGKKYSGDIYQIISDIVGKEPNLLAKFSNDLLQLGDNPLYGIDSKLKWPAYLLILTKKIEGN